MKIFHGSCHCQQVTYSLEDYPLWVVACHCHACQKRTGSDYGISAVYMNDALISFDGDTKTFSRQGNSGHNVDYEFCTNCGTSIRWFLEAYTDRQIFAVGTFDDKSDITLLCEMYTCDAAPWGPIGVDHMIKGPPNDAFRQKMISLYSEKKDLKTD